MDTLIQLDQALFYWINHGWSSGFLDTFLVPWRNSITWAPLYVFIIAFFFFNFGKRGYWLLLFTLLTVGTSDIVSSRVVKPAFERPRPCHANSGIAPLVKVRCGSGFSFTSSHATNHFAIAGFLVFTIGFLLKWLKYPLFAWAALIGLAQIYVGVHYPFDVLVGSILGLCIGKGWSLVFQKYYSDKVFSDFLNKRNVL